MKMHHIAAIVSLIAWMTTQAADAENIKLSGISIQETDTPDASDIVKVSDYIPDIEVELRYSTENNFTGERIYDFTDAYLRYGTVLKLKTAQEQLRKEDLTLLIWDAYRPVSAQFNLWNICPDPVYVADPTTGYSSHSRGNTIDVTIISTTGNPIPMPTDFDDFSVKADRDYNDCAPEEAANARKLEDTMIQAGFNPYFGEWWHYSDTNSYPVQDEFEP